MLTREIMGVLALAILWVNTLLIVAATGKEIGELKRRLARYRSPDRLLKGVVDAGDGPDGALATHVVKQIGRYASPEGKVIVFADSEYRSEVHGGRIRQGEHVLRLDAQPVDDGEVWPSPAAQAAAAALPSDEAFDEANGSARKARGFTREVRTPVGRGAPVWIVANGSVDEGEARKLERGDDGIVVSLVDPIAFCQSRIRLLAGAIAAMIVLALACTAVALVPPAFGLVSTIGGLLCLVYFLLVQPAGVTARNAALPPHLRPLRGRWVRSTPKPS